MKSGTHHITLRQSRKTSLAPQAQTSLYEHFAIQVAFIMRRKPYIISQSDITFFRLKDDTAFRLCTLAYFAFPRSSARIAPIKIDSGGGLWYTVDTVETEVYGDEKDSGVHDVPDDGVFLLRLPRQDEYGDERQDV
ncbi:MAG: hypothetical protein IKD54_02935 [Clostridia bacterium]|nr:hypothetical protein [Clostridia bacterium]